MKSHDLQTVREAPESAASMASSHTQAEFDGYAKSYDSGMGHPLKQLAGGSAHDFMRPKVNRLLSYLRNFNSVSNSSAPMRLLDVGCGTGLLLRCLRSQGFSGELFGCDVSQRMLTQAERSWDGPKCPSFDLIVDGRLPYVDQSFDIAVACAVFHHVIPDERAALFREINRVLTPGGMLLVFEHNPWNPLTQFVVRTTEIDRNAVLLSARETCERSRAANFEVMSTEYLMFFPPRWSAVASAEDYLRWLPVGAQYIVAAATDRHSFD